MWSSHVLPCAFLLGSPFTSHSLKTGMSGELEMPNCSYEHICPVTDSPVQGVSLPFVFCLLSAWISGSENELVMNELFCVLTVFD